MPTEVEEVLFDSDSINAEHRLPDARDGSFHFSLRRHVVLRLDSNPLPRPDARDTRRRQALLKRIEARVEAGRYLPHQEFQVRAQSLNVAARHGLLIVN